jgi:hypothetical protein
MSEQEHADREFKWTRTACVAGVVWIVVAVVVAALAVTAGAATIVAADGSAIPTYQRWANEADVAVPPGVVMVRGESCPGQPGVACAGRHVGEPTTIYLPADEFIDRGLRRTFWHELGHIFDYFIATDRMRGAFVGFNGGSFTGEPGYCPLDGGQCSNGWWRSLGGNSAHEQFAEAYSFCARDARRFPFNNFGSDFGWEPRSQRHHRRVCRLIESSIS